MWYLFLITFTLAFVLGQFARVNILPGLTLLGMDAVALIFAGYFLGLVLLKKQSINNPLLKPFLIFVGIACLALLVNLGWIGIKNGAISAMYLIRFTAYFGLFLYVASQAAVRKRLLEKSLLVVIGVTVVIGFFQIFFYPNLRNLYYLGWDDHLYRLFSVFLDPNYTGVLFVLFLIYLAYYFLKFKKDEVSKKIILTVLFVSTFVSVFLTYSRTALVTLVFGGFFYLGLARKKSLILLFSFVVFLLFMSTINPHVEGLNPFRVVSTKARLTSYQISLNIFAANPVLGVGFNAYRYAQNKYGYRVGGAWETSHADAGTDNSFLFVLATTGILGFSAFSYFLYKLVLTLREKMPKQNLAKYALVSLIAVFIASFFVNAFFYPFVLAWLWVVIGLSFESKKT